ncbi:hypothetical protein BGZ83_002335, partial [Gryganskiella cystojenkinii]
SSRRSNYAHFNVVESDRSRDGVDDNVWRPTSPSPTTPSQSSDVDQQWQQHWSLLHVVLSDRRIWLARCPATTTASGTLPTHVLPPTTASL